MIVFPDGKFSALTAHLTPHRSPPLRAARSLCGSPSIYKQHEHPAFRLVNELFYTIEHPARGALNRFAASAQTTAPPPLRFVSRRERSARRRAFGRHIKPRRPTPRQLPSTAPAFDGAPCRTIFAFRRTPRPPSAGKPLPVRTAGKKKPGPFASVAISPRLFPGVYSHRPYVFSYTSTPAQLTYLQGFIRNVQLLLKHHITNSRRPGCYFNQGVIVIRQQRHFHRLRRSKL